MLEKTIKKVLRGKIDEWIKSVKDEEVVKAIKRSLLISGGCIPSLVLNEPVNDYDCYFRDAKDLYKVVRYYTKEGILIGGGINENLDLSTIDGDPADIEVLQKYFKEGSNLEGAKRLSLIVPSNGIIKNEPLTQEDETDETKKDSKQSKYEFRMATSNALTLSNKIQVIMRFVGEINEIHENFDFEHAKCWYNYNDNKLSISAKAYELIINKKIKYKHSKYPICSLFRLRKFIKRGWNVSAGDILKIAIEVHNLKLDTIADLQEQLIGVDSSYFSQLILALSKGRNFDLENTGYLFNLIDKIF